MGASGGRTPCFQRTLFASRAAPATEELASFKEGLQKGTKRDFFIPRSHTRMPSRVLPKRGTATDNLFWARTETWKSRDSRVHQLPHSRARAARARLAGPGREGDPSLPSERCRVRARIEIENTGASYASFIIAGGRRAQCLKNGLYWYHGSASRPRREERREILRAYHSSKLSRAWMS